MPSEQKQAKLPRELILDPAARIRQLSDHGSSVQIDKAIPIKRYYRSGSEMERQARVYYSEGQLDRAFILYNKFATLFIEKIPKHPEFSKAAPTDKARIKGLLKQAFPRAMELKDKLKVQFEKDKKELEKTIAEEECAKREEEERQRQREAAQRQREEAAQREREERLREAQELKEKTREPDDQLIFIPSEPVGVYTQEDSTSQPSTDQLIVDSSPSVTENEPSSIVKETEPAVTAVPTEAVGLTEEGPSESLHLTATDPNLAHVLPELAPAPAPMATDPGIVPPMSTMEGLTLNEGAGQSAQPGAPSAPPPTYDQAYRDGLLMGGTHPLGQSAMGVVSPQQSAMGVVSPQQSAMGVVSPQQSAMGVVSPQQSAVGGMSPGQSVTLNPVLRQHSYDTMFQAPYQAPPVVPQQQAPPPGHAYSNFHGAPPTAASYQWPPYETGQFGGIPTHQPAAPRPLYTSQSFDVVSERRDEPQVPVVDRSSKPASLKALSTNTSWEGSEGYRTVVLPADTATQFEQVASPNTRKNIETCGILAGKLAKNVFRVTHIIVPKQKGQSDSCETLNEEELFDAQDKYDLITLGWIHTHPSQTAFMSSVDLHCHCSYQIMLDEAIAIVCAPKYSQVGVYMLTEPHGLNYITHCEQEGFHDHPKNPPLYEECKHIQQDGSAFIQVVDLR